MLKKWQIGVALGALMAIGVSAGARADEAFIPLICKGFQHQFWQSVKLGAEQQAKADNVKITFEGPETEAMVDKQIDMLSADLAKHPNAIGFAALDSKAAIPLLKKAQAENIPVIAFNSGVDSDIPLTTCRTDSVAAGATAADKMAEMIGDSGEVAVIVHDQTSRTGIDRRDGFLNEMKEKHPNIKIVSVQYGEGDHLKSAEIAKADIEANPEPQGHLRRQRRLGGGRGDRRQGVGQEARPDRLRRRQGAKGRDPVRPDGGRNHPEPDRHRQMRRRFGGQGAEGRETAEGDRHRLLLVRQDQHRRSEDRRLFFTTERSAKGKGFGPSPHAHICSRRLRRNFTFG